MRAIWGLAVVLGVVGAGQEAAERALEAHQGTWRVVSFERDGKAADPAVVGSIRRIVRGDHVTWEREGKSFAGTSLKLDPAADPPALEVVADGGPSRGKATLGIYRLEGDELTICMADPDRPRPSGFTTVPGSGLTLMRFVREKAEAEKGAAGKP